MSDLLQIVWASEAVHSFSTFELVTLLAHSRRENESRLITGMLLYHQMSFLQLMEGEGSRVDFVFENRIKRDKRHTNITLLLRRTVELRNFSDWSMGFIDTSERDVHSLPGFHDYRETTGGFLPLLGDAKVVASILKGFHEGRWHHAAP